MLSYFEDENELPYTAGDRAGWIVLIAALTLGWAAIALGVFLGVWVRLKRRSGAAFAGFLFCTVVELAAHISRNLPASIITWMSSSAGIVWIASCYLLRHEVQVLYRERWNVELEIGPVFTFIFGPLYINYCLNPPALLDDRGPMTLGLLNRSEKTSS